MLPTGKGEAYLTFITGFTMVNSATGRFIFTAYCYIIQNDQSEEDILG